MQEIICIAAVKCVGPVDHTSPWAKLPANRQMEALASPITLAKLPHISGLKRW